MDTNNIYDKVQERYAAAAKGPESRDDIASAFGYSVEELENVPEGANLGLSCGNPHGLANLKDVLPTYQRPTVSIFRC
jgi:hypothetical protein